RAYVDLDAGRVREAEEAARHVEPGEALVLADVLQAQGRHAEALAAVDAVIAAHAGNASALLQRGSLCLRLARWKEAAAAFDAAIRLDVDRGDDFEPVRARALAGMAESVAHLGDAAAARTIADLAERAATPEDAATWLHVAIARRLIGDAAGARRDRARRRRGRRPARHRAP